MIEIKKITKIFKENLNNSSKGKMQEKRKYPRNMKYPDTFEWSWKTGSFLPLSLTENANLSVKRRCAAKIKLQHQWKEVISGKLEIVHWIHKFYSSMKQLYLVKTQTQPTVYQKQRSWSWAMRKIFRRRTEIV